MGWLKADILTVAWLLHARTHGASAADALVAHAKGMGRALNGFLFHGGARNGGFVNGDSE